MIKLRAEAVRNHQIPIQRREAVVLAEVDGSYVGTTRFG